MIKTISFLVRGRVQGVGFRYFVLRTAENLGLTGWVRNNPNGDVQGFAQGKVDRLKDFENWLWTGSVHSHVIDVQIEECCDRLSGDQTEKSDFNCFQIMR